MIIEIDHNSGFCHGVTRAIGKAEETLRHGGTLYCLGDIVHNSREVERLGAMGLRTIDHAEYDTTLHDAQVLLRAHGEPPSTYSRAKEAGITLIDATCPVVLHLQERIKKEYDAQRSNTNPAQIVIYGKPGHAEVVGLVGQTSGTAIVIENEVGLDRLDYNRDIVLYSQTTKSLDGFNHIVEHIKAHISSSATFRYYDTICRQVANRMTGIRSFAQSHDVIVFVSGRQSSNGKVLFAECCAVNARCHLVDSPDEIQPTWFMQVDTVGICGATSTPLWLMEQCKERIERL